MDKDIIYYLQYLKKVCPELTASDLELFSQGLTVSALNKKEIYLKSGEIQPYNRFIVKGLVREFYTDEQGIEKNLDFIAEHQYACHYPAFMDKTPSPFSYQCLEPTIFVNLPVGHIDKAYKMIPAFERYGRLAMEKNIKQQQQRLISLQSQTAEQRYLDFIARYPDIFRRVSVSHLASYLGVERQTLTRLRKKLFFSDKK